MIKYTILAIILSPALVLAGDVPPITVAEFEQEASLLWQILAGQGVWGAIIFAVVTAVWRIGKPYLDDWMHDKKMARLYDAVVIGVTNTLATYVEAAKAASTDGKLTEAEAAHARDLARQYVVSYMKTQGVDVIKYYGEDIINGIIERVLAMLKIESKMASMVVGPLPELEPKQYKGK